MDFLDDEPSSSAQPLALPSTYLSGRQVRTSIALSREARGQQNQTFQQQVASEKLQLATRAQDLHDQHQDIEWQKLSLSQLQAVNERAKTVEALVAARTKLANDINERVAGAALAEKLGELDHTAKDFPLQWSKAFAQYSDGANSPAVTAVAKMKEQQFTDYLASQKAEKEEVFKATLPPRLEAINKSEYVPGEIKNSLVGPDGNVNVGVLTQAEQMMKTGKDAESKDAHIQTITEALKVLGAHAEGEPQSITDSRYNLNQALKDKTFGLQQATGAALQPATTTPAVATPTSAAAAPTAPVAQPAAAAPNDSVSAFVSQFQSKPVPSTVPATAPSEVAPAPSEAGTDDR